MCFYKQHWMAVFGRSVDNLGIVIFLVYKRLV